MKNTPNKLLMKRSAMRIIAHKTKIIIFTSIHKFTQTPKIKLFVYFI